MAPRLDHPQVKPQPVALLLNLGPYSPLLAPTRPYSLLLAPTRSYSLLLAPAGLGGLVRLKSPKTIYLRSGKRPSSSGQDGCLPSSRHGFESRWTHSPFLFYRAVTR